MSAAIARTAAAAAARRPISFTMKFRSMGRAMEHHPYERLSISQTSARADWAKEIKSVSGKLVVYLPSIGLLLGWPLIAQKVLDGHI